MPTEDYDARALALSLDDESPSRGNGPSWSRRSTSFRRSGSFQRPTPSLRERIMDSADKLHRRAMSTYRRLSLFQRILFITGSVTIFILVILFLVYNERIFHSMLPYAKKWRDIRGGWLILWALIFTVSFPPLIGYSTLLTVAGFVYGFPNGYDMQCHNLPDSSFDISMQMVYCRQCHNCWQHCFFHPLAQCPQKHGRTPNS